MLNRIMNALPRGLLVYAYRKFPLQSVKNWIVVRAQRKFLIGVVGIITNREGEVLLLHHVYREEPWGMPGGWMEYEQPGDALAREIREETGFEVKLSETARAIYRKDPNRMDLVFRGEILSGSFRSNAEISEMCFASPGRWPQGMPEEQQRLIEDVLNGQGRGETHE